jgi:L-iditol 2-dehydrogenase
VDVPRPADDEVLIRILRIGICGSDIHVYHGQHPYTDYPIVQGHEVSGIVEKTGESVKGFTKGDYVTFMPQVTCGRCYSCTNGMYHICDDLKVMGFQIDGAAQEYFPVKSEMVLKLSSGMNLEEGALLEPAAVAVHAVKRSGDISSKNVVVLGAGPIGNLTAQIAAGMGAHKVMITDINDFRLELAGQCGIDFTVNPLREELGEVIDKRFGFSKADIIFECVGSQDTISQSVSLARKGSTIVVVGVFGEKPVIDLGMIQDREIMLLGTLMYQKDDFLKAMELASNGKVKLGKLITDTFSIKDYKEAYNHIEENRDRVMKVLVSL